MQNTESVEVPVGLSDLKPSEIDALMARIYMRLEQEEILLKRAKDAIHQSARDNRLYGRRQPKWEKTFHEVMAIVEEHLTSDTPVVARIARENLDKLAEIEGRIDVENEKLMRLDAEYNDRGGWVRAFLVSNGDGHVHSTTNCSTCNRGQSPTQFQWMTEFSGLTEKAVVDAAGWRACTVCYPTAPVGDKNSLPTTMFSDEDKAKEKARIAREEKKAAALAKKIANGLTEDGSEFVVSWLQKDAPAYERQGNNHIRVIKDVEKVEYFKTERTAVTWVVDTLVDAQSSWGGEYSKNMAKMRKPATDAVIEAVAKKHGKTVEEAASDIDKKVKAKLKRM